MENQEVVRRLRLLEGQRAAVQAMETALQSLTPEELLVLNVLVIAPRPGGAEQLCHILNVEKSSVYRRKDRALRLLAKALDPDCE